jgi:hypothetical protein
MSRQLTTPFDAWTPGTTEAERFREDLYLRIRGTTMLMNHALDKDATGIIADLQCAAATGMLHEERADIEWDKIADIAQHERFVYNWAHVMLTTRVVDTLRTLAAHLNGIVPKANYGKTGGELGRLAAEFSMRCNIDLSKSPDGVEFLEGMVLARNKIIHNAGMLWEGSSDPNTIQVEGDEPWTPATHDQEFIKRFPVYADNDRITITKELFETNANLSLRFIEWLTNRFDQFVRFLNAPTTSTPS